MCQFILRFLIIDTRTCRSSSPEGICKGIVFTLCICVCVCVCVRACVRTYVRACVHACVRACVRCVRACVFISAAISHINTSRILMKLCMETGDRSRSRSQKHEKNINIK